jgi:hypothetical protein
MRMNIWIVWRREQKRWPARLWLLQTMGFPLINFHCSCEICLTELQPLNISTELTSNAFQSTNSISVVNARKSDHTSQARMTQLEKDTKILGSKAWSNILVSEAWSIPCLCLSQTGLQDLISSRTSSSLGFFACSSPQMLVWYYYLISIHKSLSIGRILTLCWEMVTSQRRVMNVEFPSNKNGLAIVRSGQTAAGFERRYKQHQK